MKMIILELAVHAKCMRRHLSDGEIVVVKKLWNVKKDGGSRDYGFEIEV